MFRYKSKLNILKYFDQLLYIIESTSRSTKFSNSTFLEKTLSHEQPRIPKMWRDLVVKNPSLDTSRTTPPLNHFPNKSGQGNIRSFHEKGRRRRRRREAPSRPSVVSASRCISIRPSAFSNLSHEFPTACSLT